MKSLIAAALLVYASPALAGSLVTTSSCKFSGYYGYSNCQATMTFIQDPVRDLEQERQDATERHQEDAMASAWSI